MPATNDKVADELAPIFLEFGKAIYICQCLESSLCLLLTTMTHETTGGEEGAFQASWDFYSEQTLGKLLRLLREKIEVPKDVDDYLRVGLRKRNEIVHGFLTKNAMRLLDPKGRLEVEEELVKLKKEIKHRDMLVNKLLDTVLKK